MNEVFLHDGLSFNLVTQGTGAPVVFQHGLCGSAAQTGDVFPHGHGFTLLTLDCRGHGQSDAGSHDAFSIARFADDVAAMMATKAAVPCVLGGISMGAAIALRLAVHHPDRVKALILARPAWVTDAAPENCQPNREVGDLLASHDPQTARDMFLQSTTAQRLERTAPDNLKSLLSFFDRKPTATTSALLRAIATDGPGVTAAQLKAIQVPTLIIATEQDVIHPMTHAQDLHQLIPASRLAVITPKGESHARYTTEFRDTLLTFLEETA